MYDQWALAMCFFMHFSFSHRCSHSSQEAAWGKQEGGGAGGKEGRVRVCGGEGSKSEGVRWRGKGEGGRAVGGGEVVEVEQEVEQEVD